MPIPRLYAMIGIGAIMVLFLAWVARIDHLRAAHLKQYQAEHAAFVQFQADVRAKTELARISDLAHKAAVERDQEKVRAENDTEIRNRIAAAVASVRNNAQSHSSSGRSPAVPRPANAPSGPAGADTAPLVSTSDIEVCAVNTVKAEGWQSWWRSVEAIPR